MAVQHDPASEPMAAQILSPGSKNSGPSESTALLNRSDSGKETKEVHYRGIKGRQFWWLFSCIMVASLIAFFDSTLMASSHPVIASYFQTSNSSSWLSTVFFLTSTVSQPLYGRISDVTGRRTILLFTLSIFFFGTLGCAAAQDMSTLIIARAICGIGAGGITTMTSIIISDVVKLEYRGIYQSYYNLAWGCGNGLGAALGGLLCDRLGWRAAFGIQLPFIFLNGVVAFTVTPKDLGPNLAKVEGKTILQALKDFDTPGAVTLMCTLSCFILGINLGGNIFPWTHPIVLASLCLFIVSLCALIIVEQRGTARPILPLFLLSNFPIANLMWASLLSAVVANTIIFNVPIFLQVVRQESPTMSGLYLISPLVGASITGIFAGFWITWTRKMKPLIVIGSICFFIGAICVTNLNASLPAWTLVLLIPIASIGQGLNWPSTTIALLALNSQDNQAVVITTLGLLRYIGSILGVAISSLILQNSLLFFLERTVTGPDKEHIILIVRQSVKAIAKLSPQHKAQVIEAYSLALRLTFASGIIAAVFVIGLCLPIKLPDLHRKPTNISREDQVEESV